MTESTIGAETLDSADLVAAYYFCEETVALMQTLMSLHPFV